jgi:hypothetical protein
MRFRPLDKVHLAETLPERRTGVLASINRSEIEMTDQRCRLLLRRPCSCAISRYKYDAANGDCDSEVNRSVGRRRMPRYSWQDHGAEALNAVILVMQ